MYKVLEYDFHSLRCLIKSREGIPLVEIILVFCIFFITCFVFSEEFFTNIVHFKQPIFTQN